MKRRFFMLLVRGTLAAALGAWCVAGAIQSHNVSAQDAATEDEVAADDKAAQEDLFKIPSGNADQIHKFMIKLTKAEAKGDTEEEQTEYAKKILRTMATACDRLMKAKPNKSQLLQAHQFKISALSLLAQNGDDDAARELTKAVNAARSSSISDISGLGWQMFVQLQTNRWGELDDEAKERFRNEIVAQARGNKLRPQSVSIVRVVASSLEREDDPFVADLLAQTLPAFEKSKDPKVRQALQRSSLQGLARRMNLLGNAMEINGTLLDGKKVDWNSYRGKVVLVDFWATWCGPCRAEVPNVLEMYQAYHDKGFEVLGVSLDQTPEDAHSYVEEMQIPWPSIFPKAEKDRGWNHPLADYYGITGIPTAILVGKDGKVVHMEARGPVLREQLQELLGDPVEPAAEETTDGEEAES
jgi:thiol-disulfide isomerase/thioredoxin